MRIHPRLVVLQCGECDLFGHRVELVWSTGLLHFHHQRWLPDGVSDTQPRESERLRHRADHQQSVRLFHQVDRRNAGEFRVGLVEKHHAGRFAQRALDGVTSQEGARGIIR